MSLSADTEKDAFLQETELLARFSKEWEVRSDLIVTALGCDRNVRLTLAEFPTAFGSTIERVQKTKYHSTQRNVGTMRALAEAILAACDFVDRSNPEWAQSGRRIRAAIEESKAPK